MSKDRLLEDRPSRGQGKKCLRPRTRTKDTRRKCSPKNAFKFFFQALSKKRVFNKFFRRPPKKKSSQVFREVSGVFQRNFNDSKNSAVLGRRQGSFRGLEASRPRTSKRVLKAKNVLENSPLRFGVKEYYFNHLSWVSIQNCLKILRRF